MKEITQRADLLFLMTDFYTKATKDEIIGEKFDHTDLEAHLPIIVNFWDNMLFGAKNYRGNPFDKHIPLKLEAKHFERWLMLFEQSLFDNFQGKMADEIWNRAKSIAYIFQSKLDYVYKH